MTLTFTAPIQLCPRPLVWLKCIHPSRFNLMCNFLRSFSTHAWIGVSLDTPTVHDVYQITDCKCHEGRTVFPTLHSISIVQGYSTSALQIFQTIFCCEACPVGCRMLRNTLASLTGCQWHPLLYETKSVSRHCRMWHEEQPPPPQNHCSQHFTNQPSHPTAAAAVQSSPTTCHLLQCIISNRLLGFLSPVPLYNLFTEQQREVL